MSLLVELSLDLRSDFHIGTGMGQGRTVDAVVLRDQQGFPYIPASTLKGLARWHAERLVELQPRLGLEAAMPPDVRKNAVIVELFGEIGNEPGGVIFSDARSPVTTRVPRPEVHGRSARDRRLGRALADHLFFIEDAAALRYVTEVRSESALTHHATLLLLLALRRIEHLGGNRRRGKGWVETRLKVASGPPPFAGLKLPTGDGATGEFEKVVTDACAGTWNPPRQAESQHVQTEPVTVPASEAPVTGSGAEPISEAVLLVFARAAAALTLPDEPETGNVIGTLLHVTGSSFRGAFAAHLVRQGWPTSSPEFQEAFTRERLRFGPLYPAHEWANLPRTMSIPVPRSIVTCKYHPGVNQRDASHGVRDLLGGRPLATCPCGAPLVPWGGFVQIRGNENSQFLERLEPARTSVQRTAVDPETLRGQDGALYSTAGIEQGTFFGGYLRGPASLLNAVTAGYVDRPEPLVLRAGKSRTRGHGALEVWLRRPARPLHPYYPMLLPQDHEANLDRSSLRVTLYSDLVAFDPLLRPITRLTEDALWNLLRGTGNPPFLIERGYTVYRQIAGFNGVPGLPRSPDLALVAGSVWELHWKAGADATAKQETAARLAEAQRTGLGLRRGEGLGQILIDLPLHDIGEQLNQFTAPGPPTSFPAKVPSERGLPEPPLKAAAELRQWVKSSLRGTPMDPPPPGLGERAGGFARLLRQLAQEADPIAGIEKALEQRRTFHRSAKREDQVLAALKKLLEASRSRVAEGGGETDEKKRAERIRSEAARALLEYAEALAKEEIESRGRAG